MDFTELLTTFATSTNRIVDANNIRGQLNFQSLDVLADYLRYDDVDCLWEEFGDFRRCSRSNRFGEYAYFELSQDIEDYIISLVIPFDGMGRRSGLARFIVTYAPENLEIQRLELYDDLSEILHSDISCDIKYFFSLPRLVNRPGEHTPSTHFRIDHRVYTKCKIQQTIH